jgi:hypothetical protein
VSERPLSPVASEEWRRAIAAVERPETVLPLAADPLFWPDFLARLAGQGLFPLAYAAWRAAGLLPSLPPTAREEAEARMNRYRAASAAAWGEIERTLDLLRGGGFRPVLLKGADLALRYYPEVHLRPLSDLDLLLESPGEAEGAFGLLEGAGYRREEEGIPLDFWALSQHLPVLHSPGAGFPVEVHGALLFSPRDRRWTRGAASLLRDTRDFTGQGRALRGLAPEALAVHLCAHTWLQHANEPPKAVVLFDLRAVLEREGAGFSWDRLAERATEAGVAGAVARGFGLLRAHLSVPVPEQVLGGLAAEGGGERLLRLPPEAAATEDLLRRLRQGGLAPGFLSAWRILVPPAAYMRERYPARKKWPLAALYPARWAEQARKLGRWALALWRGR